MKLSNRVSLIMNLVEDSLKEVIKYNDSTPKPRIRYINHPDGTMSIWTKLTGDNCDFNINWDEDNPGAITITPINIKASFINKSSRKVYVDYSDNKLDIAEQIEDIFQDYL